MKVMIVVAMSILLLASAFVTAPAKACPCNCDVLQACYADCKRLMPDTLTTMGCDLGCLIACKASSD